MTEDNRGHPKLTKEEIGLRGVGSKVEAWFKKWDRYLLIAIIIVAGFGLGYFFGTSAGGHDSIGIVAETVSFVIGVGAGWIFAAPILRLMGVGGS